MADGDFIVDVIDTTVVSTDVAVVDAISEVSVVDLNSSTAAGGGVDKLVDLLDVNASNLTAGTNKYVLTYDVSTQKFVFANPDSVIDSAVGVRTDDPAPVGLTTDTINYLDVVLDNKIDLDAGEW